MSKPKLKKARRQRRRVNERKWRTRPKGNTYSIVGTLDGSPVDPDCACPVCAQMALEGIPSYTMGPDGELVELERGPVPEMMRIRVSGDATVRPHLAATRDEVVPVGCVAHDLLEYLCFQNAKMRRAFPPGALVAWIDGQPCEPNRVLLPGDQVTVRAASAQT